MKARVGKKREILAWLESRANAHYKRYQEYLARAAKYREADFFAAANRDDEKIASDLADENLFMSIALRNAIRDIENKVLPDALPDIVPPVVGSLAWVIEKGIAREGERNENSRC